MGEVLFDANLPLTPELYVEKYEAAINDMLEQVSAPELFHGMRTTVKQERDDYFNVVYKVRNPEDTDDMYLTIKCHKSGLYYTAYRRGQGDPPPNSKDVWRQCKDWYDRKPLPGAVRAKFDSDYDIDHLGVGPLGPTAIEQAVRNLWYNKNIPKSSFLLLCVHFPECARSKLIFSECKKHVRDNLYAKWHLESKLQTIIKNWKTISKAIWENKLAGQPFDIKKKELADWGIDTAVLSIGILLHCEVNVEEIKERMEKARQKAAAAAAALAAAEAANN